MYSIFGPSRILPLVTVLSLTINSHAHADTFSDVYEAFQHAYEQNDIAASVTLSQKAWQLAGKQFGSTSENTLKLHYSYANMLVLAQQYDNAAREYRSVIKQYKAVYGDTHIDTLLTYTGILKNLNTLSYEIVHKSEVKTLKPALAKYLLRNIEEVQDASEQEHAYLYSQVAKEVIQITYMPVQLSELIRFLNTAVGKAEKQWGPNNQQTLETRYFLARGLEAKGHRTDAIDNYLSVATGFDNNNSFSHPYSLASHARLVTLYEEGGESEQATYHCQAIGQMTPWDTNQDPQPLYRVNPDYPRSQARRNQEGSVQLAFRVDTQGLVKNIKVVSTQGNESFADAAIKALSQWRYAPQFEDGKPIDSTELKVILDFTLGI